MRAKTYDGDFQYIEEPPVYQKCDVCEHLVHPDHIRIEETSGMNVCATCLPEFLQSIEDEKR